MRQRHGQIRACPVCLEKRPATVPENPQDEWDVQCLSCGTIYNLRERERVRERQRNAKQKVEDRSRVSEVADPQHFKSRKAYKDYMKEKYGQSHD